MQFVVCLDKGFRAIPFQLLTIGGVHRRVVGTWTPWGAAAPGRRSQVPPTRGQADAKTLFSMVRHKYIFVGSRPFS